MRTIAAIVLVMVALLAAACSRDSAGPGTSARTAALDHGSVRAARPGDRYVLLLREPTPRGLRETLERWTLTDTLSGVGDFEVRRGDRAPRFDRRALVPSPVAALTLRPRPAWAQPPAFRMETVRVPAGRFECRRTSRTYEEHSGRVMRVDEWWTPGVPVPVQRWTRWQGLPDDRLREPPARPEGLILGSEWDVLEHVPSR